MTISVALGSGVRRPGEYHEFDLTSGTQGLVALTNRVLLIGLRRTGAGTATSDIPYLITDETQAVGLFGQGSIASLMCRKALETTRLKGSAPEIWCTGVADPAGTAGTWTLTVGGGAAAASGEIVWRVNGLTMRTSVTAGDSDNTVAAAMLATINAHLSEVPVSAACPAAVMTLTFRHLCILGQDLDVEVVSVGLTGKTVAVAHPIAGATAAVLTTALANAVGRFYEGIAICNHLDTELVALGSVGTHLNTCWASGQKRWRWVVVGENDTYAGAQTLAICNDHRIVVASAENMPMLPGEIAAAIVTAISCREQPNYNWDGDTLPLYLQSDASLYTTAEIETALANGVTPLASDDSQIESQICRLVTTRISWGGNPFWTTEDLSTIRGMIYVVRQLDAAFALRFQGQNKSAEVLKRMRSVAYQVLKLCEDKGVTQNVDAHFPELQVESDPTVTTRALVSLPESIIPNLHQIVLKHVLFVE